MYSRRPHRGGGCEGLLLPAVPGWLSPRSYEQLLAKMTSKLNSELVTKAVDDILAYSAGETIKKGDAEIVGKKRKFTESIELQVRNGGWKVVMMLSP